MVAFATVVVAVPRVGPPMRGLAPFPPILLATLPCGPVAHLRRVYSSPYIAETYKGHSGPRQGLPPLEQTQGFASEAA